ncbi:hypothetical protein AGLY_015675 [Aphis glycines]|uniref:Uncharacterized protein n=1 Tax=Aphis glycines TaxID=307491 RepID=A0A6G0T0V1_APHGL|nr:hypothetical protein AGLY_015675 [Aphis glycines]
MVTHLKCWLKYYRIPPLNDNRWRFALSIWSSLALKPKLTKRQHTAVKAMVKKFGIQNTCCHLKNASCTAHEFTDPARCVHLINFSINYLSTYPDCIGDYNTYMNQKTLFYVVQSTGIVNTQCILSGYQKNALESPMRQNVLCLQGFIFDRDNKHISCRLNYSTLELTLNKNTYSCF